MKNWRLLMNIGLFQLGWFSCILLTSYWPLLVTLLILAIHFWIIVPKEYFLAEGRLLLFALLIGMVLESTYLLTGVLVHVDGSFFPPFWLLCIWVLFATTFMHSLFWLKERLGLAAVFAGISAPMSYYAGANLNLDMSLNDHVWVSIFFVSITWAVAFPAMMRFILPLPYYSLSSEKL